jgi:pimeloyl-ACP methyl ester carboxylesterase
MDEPALQTFVSAARAPLSVTYRSVGASDAALLYIPGVGGDSSFLCLLRDFAQAHAIRILCVDRWCQGSTFESADELIGDWLGLIVELVESLAITSLYPVAHSFGGILALELARRLPRDRLPSLFLVSPATAPDLVKSPALSLVKSGPSVIFHGAAFMETTYFGRYLSSLDFARPRAGLRFLGDDAANDAVAAARDAKYRVPSTRSTSKMELAIVFGRWPGRAMVDVDLWRGCDRDVTWYTSSPVDVFYGAKTAERVKALRDDRAFEVVELDDAPHYNIARRKEVWEDVVRRVKGVALS